MARARINGDSMPGRFPRGTLALIDKARRPKESRAEFLRKAVQAELRRRWKRKRAPPARK